MQLLVDFDHKYPLASTMSTIAAAGVSWLVDIWPGVDAVVKGLTSIGALGVVSLHCYIKFLRVRELRRSNKRPVNYPEPWDDDHLS